MRGNFIKLMCVCVAAFSFWGLSVGCADLGNLSQFRALNRQNLSYLKVGMTKDSVMEQMGNGFATDVYTNLQSVTATNPYKSEMHRVDGRAYEVLYYYTDTVRKKRINVHLPGLEKANPILEEELTPVVLQNNRVIGWGRAFLKTLLKGL